MREVEDAVHPPQAGCPAEYPAIEGQSGVQVASPVVRTEHAGVRQFAAGWQDAVRPARQHPLRQEAPKETQEARKRRGQGQLHDHASGARALPAQAGGAHTAHGRRSGSGAGRPVCRALSRPGGARDTAILLLH